MLFSFSKKYALFVLQKKYLIKIFICIFFILPRNVEMVNT